MKKFVSFKDFASLANLKEDLVDKNKYNIARQSLIISDKGARVAGAMPKHEAVRLLRDASVPEEEIRRLLILGGSDPQEIEYLLTKH